MAQENTLMPGWYGKIPALGDFASRRLPQGFVAAWDSWLQHSMAASRASLGPRWLDIYLTSPIWRFALLPGVVDQQAWAGLIMPSVDKVGRHFPLTVALPLRPEMVAAILTAQDWYGEMERVALATLNLDFSAEQLEGELLVRPFPAPPPDRHGAAARTLADWWQSASPGLSMALPAGHSLSDLLAAAAQDLLAATGYGKSLWWSGVDGAASVQLLGYTGLPPEERFAELLEGSTRGDATGYAK